MKNLTRISIAIGFLSLGSLMSCTSLQSPGGTLDAIKASTPSANSSGTGPFVEGWVEYAGPQARWSGPASFSLHVLAKDAKNTLIEALPAQAPLKEESKERKLASSGQPGMERLREEMGTLANEAQSSDLAFMGCMYPVRIRLVRADGSLFEKQGCRSGRGWPKAASDTVSNLIGLAQAK